MASACNSRPKSPASCCRAGPAVTDFAVKRAAEGAVTLPISVKSALGTEDFRTEYRAFVDAGEIVAVAVDRAVPGTIADLIARYFATPTRLGPTVITQSKVRSIVGRFSEEYGRLPVARVGFEHIDAIVTAKMQRKIGRASCRERVSPYV